MADVLVYVLHYQGAFNKNSLGAVSEAATRAAEIGGEAHAVVVGGDDLADDFVKDLGRYGARKVFRARGPEGLAQPVVDVLDTVISEHGQKYAIFGGGLLGFEIGAGLAARRHAGVTMEVTAVRTDPAHPGELLAERPILGDSKISVSRYRGDLGIIIGRINAFEVREDPDDAHPAEIVDVELEYSPWSTRAVLISRGEQRGEEIDIEGADILVAGGRGLGNAEGFKIVEEVAAAFGGNTAVGATRAVVDAGWYPYAAQIGQTGKTVSPKLYLAAGISGAIQHKVGMQGSENIIAINKDANAPIFDFSDLGVVGDLNKILPKLAEAIRAKRA
jgi:electron transfer flavoprotein alpha subunit